MGIGEKPVTIRRKPPWKSGVEAAWANRWPGLALAVFALGMVGSYHFIDSVRAAFDRITVLRETVGWSYALFSTVIFGALIPWIVQRLRPSALYPVPWSHLFFLSLFWAWKGVEVDLFYQFQAWLFGHGHDIATVVKKIAFDMLVYVPLVAAPTTAWAYGWKDSHLTEKGYVRRNTGKLRLSFRHWYAYKVLPVLISNIAVWTPAVAAIYMLPLALQLPMQNLVLCFWSLLVMWQVREVQKDITAHTKAGPQSS